MSHPSHNTRYSDSSLYDEVCTQCRVTDANGMALLDQPCKNAPPQTAYGQLASGGPSTPIECVQDPLSPERIAAAVKELEQIAEAKKLVEPLEPKQAVEMLPGKKYLLVLRAPEHTSRETLNALGGWADRFRKILHGHEIDAEIVVSGLPLEIYELNAEAKKCPDNF